VPRWTVPAATHSGPTSVLRSLVVRAAALHDRGVTHNERYPDAEEVAAVVEAHLRRGGWTPTDADRATAASILTALTEAPDAVGEDGTPPVRWRLDRLARVSRRARSWAAGPSSLSPPTVWLLLTTAGAFDRFTTYVTDTRHEIWSRPDDLQAEIQLGERSLVTIGNVLAAIAEGTEASG
jgi:hypothetical protein